MGLRWKIWTSFKIAKDGSRWQGVCVDWDDTKGTCTLVVRGHRYEDVRQELIHFAGFIAKEETLAAREILRRSAYPNATLEKLLGLPEGSGRPFGGPPQDPVRGSVERSTVPDACRAMATALAPFSPDRVATAEAIARGVTAAYTRPRQVWFSALVTWGVRHKLRLREEARERAQLHWDPEGQA